MSHFSWPEDRWEPDAASIRETTGPTRVVTDEPDPDYTPNPIGFAPPRIEREPLLWEGDQA